MEMRLEKKAEVLNLEWLLVTLGEGFPRRRCLPMQEIKET